jgi:hypothetical protein
MKRQLHRSLIIKIVVLVSLCWLNAGLLCAQAKPRAGSLSDQRMCAIQAKKAYSETDFAKPDPDFITTANEYTNHFDAKANVCYIMVHIYKISRKDKTRTVSYVVWDAFEGRVYANFLSINLNGAKADYLVEPMECSIKVPGQKEQSCKTTEEFEELVEKNFGVAR